MELFFYIIIHLISGIVALYLGFFVYLKDKRKEINKVFFLLTLSVSLWSLSYGIWLMQKNPLNALFWARTLNLGATLIPVFTLHWVLSFLQLKNKKILLFFYFLTSFFVIFSYSKFYIKNTAPILQFPFWPQLNWLYVLFILFGWISVLFYSFSLLLTRYKNAFGIYKEQIKYVLLGMIIGYIGGSTNYPLMFGLNWLPPVGSPLVIAFPLFFAYAMVKHRLMDIKFVLRKYFVFASSLLSVLLPAVIIKYVVNNYLAYNDVWIDFVILLLSITFFTPLKNYYYRVANKYFFSSLYDAQEVISNLSENLKSTLEIERIYKFISDTIVNSFHAKTVSVLIFSEATKSYSVNYDYGHEKQDNKEFMEDRGFYTEVLKKNSVVVIEELKGEQYKKFEQTLKLLDSYGIDILVPLSVKDKIIGLLALGAKESNDMYNEEDLRVLSIIGAQSAIALENALLYQETVNFSIKLEHEVEKATAELRSANAKLKQLDEAKSEFISIASHQLRTPLTVIKGFISMMLDRNFGELNDKQADSLEKVYDSNERLIRLVENLLNISRIESGRLQYYFKETDFEYLVKDVTEELSGSAKQKGIKINYHSSDKSYPKLVIDEEKVRQVIMNLIDNAIKYSPKSTEIDISLNHMGNDLKFCVKDQGVGIRKEETPNLFKKFSRGDKGSLFHAEGTGLGLFVAKQMTDAHNGKIWAESEGEGKGSLFCFTLPINH